MDSPVILVVDDEPLNLDIIEEFLTGRGQPYIVETASDGIEAMALKRWKSWRLTLLNMMLFYSIA